MFELISYKYLQDDWDGYEGIPVPKKMLDSAWRFLGILIQNKICTPSVMISGYGDISFYWQRIGYVEISVGPEYDEREGNEDIEHLYNTFSFLVDKGGKDYFGGENIPFEDFTKSKVYDYMQDYMPTIDCIKDDYPEYYYNLITRGEERIKTEWFSVPIIKVDDEVDKDIDKYFSKLPKDMSDIIHKNFSKLLDD